MVCYNVLRPQDKGGKKDGKQVVPTEIDEESEAGDGQIDGVALDEEEEEDAEGECAEEEELEEDQVLEVQSEEKLKSDDEDDVNGDIWKQRKAARQRLERRVIAGEVQGELRKLWLGTSQD